VNEHLCWGDWGENFSKEILHFRKFVLQFLGLSVFLFSSQERGRACERIDTCVRRR
jgi:hypothetical protein